MPSASPLYNNFNGLNNELDCQYRIPSAEAHQEARFPNGYDSLQSLSAMADQNFSGIFSSQSQSYSSHIPVTSYHNTQTATSSPSSFFSTSEYPCMYNTNNNNTNVNNMSNPRRSYDASSDDSSYNEGLTKKEFHGSKEEFYNDQDQLLSWTRKHPENWNSEEVLDWLIYTGQEKGLNMSELRAEAFQNICGAELCKLSIDEFTNLEPKYGKSLYEMLRNLLSGIIFNKPSDLSSGDYQELSPFNNPSSSPVRSQYGSPTFYTMTNRKQDSQHFNNGYSNTESFWKTDRESMPCDMMNMDSYDYDLNDHPAVPPPNMADQCSPDFGVISSMMGYPSSVPIRTACRFPSNNYTPTIPRRRPGRPRNKTVPGEEDARNNKEKKAKNQHLWEFIFDCLVNPAYNPQYLRWENQRDGVFRFVQSEAVAQLWGGFKNNENMTYEKLSRAMRHYYKRGILERVEGRRLVYKFSRKAMDRAREKRHITL